MKLRHTDGPVAIICAVFSTFERRVHQGGARQQTQAIYRFAIEVQFYATVALGALAYVGAIGVGVAIGRLFDTVHAQAGAEGAFVVFDPRFDLL